MSWKIIIKESFDLMSLAQMMHFLLDGFQMTAVAFVSVINHYHINELHLFWDTLLEKLTDSFVFFLIIGFTRIILQFPKSSCSLSYITRSFFFFSYKKMFF